MTTSPTMLPDLSWAGSVTALGLIDEYRLYFRPFVLGGGKPYFAGPRPPRHLVGTESVGEDAVRLTYAT
jgi:riboflavin biosynthesis pyrimidine reductase